MVTSRTPSRTPVPVAGVEAKGGDWHVLDLDESPVVQVLVEKLEASGRKIDALVNDAGYVLFGAVE